MDVDVDVDMGDSVVDEKSDLDMRKLIKHQERKTRTKRDKTKRMEMRIVIEEGGNWLFVL